MATANFEIGNKEFEVRFIHESGYPSTKNERGSSLVEYDVTLLVGFILMIYFQRKEVSNERT